MRLPRVLRLAAALVVPTIAVTACISSLDPVEDTNPVGTSHTITVSIEGVFNDTPVFWGVEFDIISGPNAGLGSTNDCVPACSGSGNGQVSWSYVGNGGPGTDVIEVCVFNDFGPPVPNEDCSTVTKTWVTPTPTPTATATTRPTEDDPRRERVNVGGAAGAIGASASDQAAENRARAAATPTVAVAAPRTATGTTISPPNTGDAGLH
jgi:hypothetical protein